MFTGIVQDLVEVLDIEYAEDIGRLTLNLGELTDNLELGASVAVNGVCLTVTKVQQGTAYFDVIVETLDTTNLSNLKKSSLVNVERSFSVGDEVGGHVVSGHVTGVAQMAARRKEGNNHVIVLDSTTPLSLYDGSARAQEDWLKYVFHKGFVALDGASLTVSAIDRDSNTFEISLIPETLNRTTLGRSSVGDLINVEVDAQSRTTVDTIERLMSDDQWRRNMGIDNH